MAVCEVPCLSVKPFFAVFGPRQGLLYSVNVCASYCLSLPLLAAMLT